ncbi:hypothetical protein M422DRAFT_167158 [Sphaerobolus stellatus SS14]|uniref:DUF3752 domain-containing protein n=1 Tax=Sphaerobolus stellatus (strain SS14) TaxID=990650 RepID=A0A0C9UQ60_SPHS4|nr:hypothetical protein M422DRAFT_167158 [Sphaerobolus stellatus SS14]
MSGIGPQLPPHLRKPAHDEDDEDDGPSVSGPVLPPHLLKKKNEEPPGDDDDDEEDAYVPELPPDLAGKPKRTLGPTMPSRSPPRDDDSDEEVGPMPIPGASSSTAQYDGVREFMEREERINKAREEAAKPKKLEREEWMLVPPTNSGLLGSLDPTKLKARQFSRSARPTQPTNEVSLWTETPEQKQTRLKEELEGKRRRATDVEDAPDEGQRKRSRRDLEIATQVEAYNRESRGESLVDMHQTARGKKGEKEKDEGIWDHARDMSIGGRLMDDSQRSKMIKDSRALGDRFGKGKSGFL